MSIEAEIPKLKERIGVVTQSVKDVVLNNDRQDEDMRMLTAAVSELSIRVARLEAPPVLPPAPGPVSPDPSR